MGIIDYFNAPRPRRAFYFIEVIFGMIYAVNFDFKSINFVFMFLVFISFQSMYFGIYIINDIIDYSSDRLNPYKKNRIIASGKIKRIYAFIFAIILILIGGFLAIKISYVLAISEIIFLVYNLVYTFFLKKIRYTDGFCGGLPHAGRYMMGIFLLGNFSQYYSSIAFFIIVSTFTFIKKMNDYKHYNKKIIYGIFILFGTIILLLMRFSSGTEKIITTGIFIFYSIFLIFYFRSRYFAGIFDRLSAY